MHVEPQKRRGLSFVRDVVETLEGEISGGFISMNTWLRDLREGSCLCWHLVSPLASVHQLSLNPAWKTRTKKEGSDQDHKLFEENFSEKILTAATL